MKKFLMILSISIFAGIKLFAAEPLAAFRFDSVWVFIDDKGSQIFSPKVLKDVGAYSEGFFLVSFNYDNKVRQGFLTLDGQLAMPQCDLVRPFKNGMTVYSNIVNADSNLAVHGFMNNKGEVVVKAKYLEAYDFSEGLAWVMNFDNRGYIDTSGRFIIEHTGKGFGNSFKEGFAAFANDSAKFGYINKNGEQKIDFLYDEAGDFSEGLAMVNNMGFWGYIDTTGKLIIKHSYDFARNFSGGFAFVGIPDTSMYSTLWGLISKNGNMMFNFKYKNVRDFSNGIAAAFDGKKWKYIDPQDNQIIKNTYDFAEQFKNGLAFIIDEKKKLCGFINPAGEMIYEIPYDADEVIDLRLNKKVKG